MYLDFSGEGGAMAIQTIKRWGNSLAVRIPASLADELHLREDQEVDMVVADGALVATPAIRTFNWDEYREQLAARPGDVHPTINPGVAVGSELADPTGQDDW
ncbi:MazF family transcriptional regulator [Paraburkholderia caribensis MBA4]|uniref:MazF family transcriptional regulator n=2 Tax=Paraburkholderia caribensis TaxID=75105 RepID=A0A0P0RGN2_9BURK|nr:MazF family transcriptional regulator [Paraburkholderia caribensis MBA4]AMV44387.1 MazF family transcriptional regulator [Paraburkholderia caribensis]CAG9227553.1 MazF family transcriptional regulator [Paraburkholderia caribensis]